MSHEGVESSSPSFGVRVGVLLGASVLVPTGVALIGGGDASATVRPAANEASPHPELLRNPPDCHWETDPLSGQQVFICNTVPTSPPTSGNGGGSNGSGDVGGGNTVPRFSWNKYYADMGCAPGTGETAWAPQIEPNTGRRIFKIINDCSDAVMLEMIEHRPADVSHTQEQIDALTVLITNKNAPAPTVSDTIPASTGPAPSELPTSPTITDKATTPSIKVVVPMTPLVVPKTETSLSYVVPAPSSTERPVAAVAPGSKGPSGGGDTEKDTTILKVLLGGGGAVVGGGIIFAFWRRRKDDEEKHLRPGGAVPAAGSAGH